MPTDLTFDNPRYSSEALLPPDPMMSESEEEGREVRHVGYEHPTPALRTPSTFDSPSTNEFSPKETELEVPHFGPPTKGIATPNSQSSGDSSQRELLNPHRAPAPHTHRPPAPQTYFALPRSNSFVLNASQNFPTPAPQFPPVREYRPPSSLLSSIRQVASYIPQRCRHLALKGEGWLLAALIAILTSVSAAWIEVAVRFLSDLRIGLCYGMIWQDRNFCCGSRTAVDFHGNACFVNESPVVHMDHIDHARWLSWSTVFSIHQNGVGYVLDYGIYTGIGVLLAVLAAWLCQKFSTAAAGSGIPEVKAILGGFVMKGVLGGWTCLVKCVGLSLAVASGLCLGKEGPLVHVACCWANMLASMSTKYGRREGKRRELLSAASAAGVSVAFGAPLGGVLFSLEEVSSYFPPKTLWKSFFGAVVGALSLKYVDTSGTGRLTLFQMDSVSFLGTWQIVELIPFALIGLLGGALGALFIKLNVYWMTQKRRYASIAANPILEVAVVTAATGILNYPVSMLRTSGSSLLEQMFSRCGVGSDLDLFSMCSNRADSEASYSDYSLSMSVMAELVFAASIRFLQTVFTFGIGLPAGLFIPSLMIGALCGRLVGLLVIRLNVIFGFVSCHKCLHPGVYAIVGAAAMLGGVTRATISIVVIMFELTGGLSYIAPFMVAVMVAKWVGEALLDKSIYDCYIRLKGYPYLNEDSEHSFTAKAEHVMETRLVVLTLEGDTVESLRRKVDSYNFHGFPLVNTREDRMLLGFTQSARLREVLNAAEVFHRISNETPIRFLRFQPNPQDRNRRMSADFSTRGIGRRLSETFTLHQRHDQSLVELQERGEVGSSVDENPVLDLSHVVDEQTIQLVPETPLSVIYNIFRQLDLRLCLLSHHGRLEGLLTKQKFLQHIDRLRGTPTHLVEPHDGLPNTF